MFKRIATAWAALQEMSRVSPQAPQRKLDNEDVAVKALMMPGHLPRREAVEIVKRAGITGRDTEGQAVVKAFQAARVRRVQR